MNLLFLISLLILIPAALPISLIYIVTKNYEKKRKDIINAFSVAFFIPFMNFIFLRYVQSQHDLSSISLYPHLIGFMWLCIILPALFFIIILIPQKDFTYRKWTLVTILLTGVIGWSLIFLSSLLDTGLVMVSLEEFRPTINYIKDYRKQNQVYPKNLNEYQPKLNTFTDYKYTLLGNGKEFKLTVSGNKNSISSYNYCSNSKFDGCNTKSSPPTIRNKVGSWIEEYESFD